MTRNTKKEREIRIIKLNEKIKELKRQIRLRDLKLQSYNKKYLEDKRREK